MGADFCPKTVIGIKVKGRDILKKVKYKTFNHDYLENVNFCPETGRELWQYTYNFIDGEHYSEEKIYGLPIGKTCNDIRDILSADFYIGIFVKEFLSVDKIQDTLNKVKEILVTNNFLLGNFGVHNYLYCSC